MGLFSHDNYEVEPDWEEIHKVREIAKKLMKEKFADESDGGYEAHDYFDPPEDFAVDQHRAKCNFCQQMVLVDAESMAEHLVDNHLDKLEDTNA